MNSIEEIQAKADYLLKVTGLGKEFPLSVEKVVEHLGFKCHFYIPDEDIKDVVCTVSHIKRKFYVNENVSQEQQRFSIACKIGHIILHGKNKDYSDNLSPLKNYNYEREAEIFACSLLMPGNIFCIKCQQCEHNTVILGKFFGVTQAVVQKQAELLGINNLLYSQH